MVICAIKNSLIFYNFNRFGMLIIINRKKKILCEIKNSNGLEKKSNIVGQLDELRYKKHKNVAFLKRVDTVSKYLTHV